MKSNSEFIGRRNDSPCAAPANGYRAKQRPSHRKTPAVGMARTDRPPNDTRMITISFDNDTFTQVRERAIRERTSFAEQVRRFVEWGLESC